jgi:hypothetical protein
MVRVAVSLKNRVAPPEVVVERLASAVPADRLAKALTAYGRLSDLIPQHHPEPLIRAYLAEIQKRLQRSSIGPFWLADCSLLAGARTALIDQKITMVQLNRDRCRDHLRVSECGTPATA